MKKIRCENCDWSGNVDEKKFIPLAEVDNLLGRIAPGERVPVGECTECGAFVHFDNMTVDEALATLKSNIFHDSYEAKDALDLITDVFKEALLTFHCPRCTGGHYGSEKIGNTLRRTCHSCPGGDKFTWLDKDDNKYFSWVIHVSKESMGRK